MQVTTRALVISAIKYGEADLVVSCFTESYGLKSYHLRGILKSKKGKLRKSLFQPLTFLELNAIHKDRGSLERIQEAKVSFPYESLHTEVVKSTLVMFLSEILKSTIKEEESNAKLFHFLEYSFRWLDMHDEIANFHLLFLLKLSEYLGFSPDFGSESKPWFNLLEGVFQNTKEGSYSESGIAVEVLQKLDQKDYNNLKQIAISKSERRETLGMLLDYYKLHIQGFKSPKSLPILSQLFN